MISYTHRTMGTFTLCQESFDYVDGEVVNEKDEKGRPIYNKFRIQIREGNCLAVFMHIYKESKPKNPELPWRHELVSFFYHEAHMKNVLKDETIESFFSGKIRNIKLNLFFKESKILLKWFTKNGYKVTCYYKEVK